MFGGGSAGFAGFGCVMGDGRWVVGDGFAGFAGFGLWDMGESGRMSRWEWNGRRWEWREQLSLKK